MHSLFIARLATLPHAILTVVSFRPVVPVTDMLFV